LQCAKAGSAAKEMCSGAFASLELELELELIHTQMALKPMLRP
jgi:hypothetical protein